MLGFGSRKRFVLGIRGVLVRALTVLPLISNETEIVQFFKWLLNT